MIKSIAALFAIALVCGFVVAARADEAADTMAIVDKAIKAVGGEEALTKIKAVSWKSKTTIKFA